MGGHWKDAVELGRSKIIGSLIGKSDRVHRMLDPVLLRTFLVVAQGNSFSETSRLLSLRQSTVSDHVRRLEQHLGRRLFVRDTHTVALTPEGEALIGYASQIMETAERAEQYLSGARRRGRLRFGATEDLITSYLPDVLRDFMREHPDTDLELTVALSTTLITRYDAGELDLVFCKRWPGEDRGEVVQRDRIVWGGRPELVGPALEGGGPVPLVLYPPSSITRSMTIAALSEAGIDWRLACASTSLSGLVAAARAGLGLMVLAHSLLPGSLEEVRSERLPVLGELDFILLRPMRRSLSAASELSAFILARARDIVPPRVP